MANVDLLFIVHRAGNLVVPNLSTEVSDVSSSSGPVKLVDLQRILNNLSAGPVGINSLSFGNLPVNKLFWFPSYTHSGTVLLFQVLLEMKTKVNIFSFLFAQYEHV